MLNDVKDSSPVDEDNGEMYNITSLRTPTDTEIRRYADEDAAQYGEIPEGEQLSDRNGQRVTRPNQHVPRSVDEGTKVRQTYRTAMEAKSIPDAYATGLLREVVNGTASYTPITNREAIKYANERLDGLGYEEALME